MSAALSEMGLVDFHQILDPDGIRRAAGPADIRDSVADITHRADLIAGETDLVGDVTITDTDLITDLDVHAEVSPRWTPDAHHPTSIFNIPFLAPKVKGFDEKSLGRLAPLARD